ncbi:MAG: anthranilate phosphoribosyltransferase [Actinomycetes bacterium]
MTRPPTSPGSEPGTAPPFSWPALLTTLLRGEPLDSAATRWAMSEAIAGEASPAQLAGFVTALRAKGETDAEVFGLAEAMLDHAPKLAVSGRVVDTCGSGGDRAHTVNISTMAAIVVAATGARVVKHGNRAASSACGSADLLEELGVVVDLGPDAVAACVDDAGIGFCFAPVFHAGMRHAATTRRDLGVPTVFNFLGPLTNPARPAAQAVGVSDPRMAPVVAGVLAAREVSALVFRGDDGLDELTTATTSQVWCVDGGTVTHRVLDPAALGMAAPADDALRGADAVFNADVARRMLDGEQGAVRDAVLLNAGAALVAYDKQTGQLDDALPAAIERAAAALDDGSAHRVLTRWTDASQRLASGS